MSEIFKIANIQKKALTEKQTIEKQKSLSQLELKQAL